MKQLNLPAAAIAAEVNGKLAENASLVITAPPGAGKSTVLPLTILQGLEERGVNGKVLMLEPRRLAARQIAERIAWTLDEKVGQTVGYRIRFESKIGQTTKIEVLTEGILTRMLIDDPTLDGVAAVIFDEFHERSLNSDLTLALTRESMKLVRPDLRIVIMSATIDAESICKALDAPLIESEGRMFPVDIVHCDEPAEGSDIAAAVAHTIRIAHKEKFGDILAFLPGEAEIRRCQALLGEALSPTAVLPLYGMLPFEEQRRAIAPSLPGERKVVLATPIAETSLTIESVRIVVDSGLCRKMVFNPQSGLSRMETVRISMDMANQRSGRAGRVAEGTCYRLWSLGTETRMAPTRIPEILEADLADTVLAAAAWGESDIMALDWLTHPEPAAVAKATTLLRMLGAISKSSQITAHGRKLASLPCHPRIAEMLLQAGSPEQKALAADIAALLEEKDPLRMETDGSDLSARIEGLRRARSNRQTGRIWGRIVQIAQQYRSLVKVQEDNSSADQFEVGRLVASAYPERVAKARAGISGQYLLSSGETAFLDPSDQLTSHEWIAVASVNSSTGRAGKIFLAAPVDPKDLRSITRERDRVTWDSRKGAVVAQHELNIGCLLVEARQIHGEAREEIVKAICEAARKEGTSMLDFSSDEVQNLQRRVAAVRSWHPELELPDISTETVLEAAPEWLPPYIGNATNVQELKKIDMAAALWAMMSYEQQKAVDRLAPTHIEVPTGSRIRVEYRLGADAPVLRVRLQECFGLLDTPRVDGGRLPVLMELLSPGFKPVQLTSDLHSFWQGTYFEVRSELRRRYPKHSWPDNPLEAKPVRGVKKNM